MPNFISGLGYYPPVKKVDTEEQLLQVFRDLREHYETIRKNFRITQTPEVSEDAFKDEPVASFKHLLQIVGTNNPKVFLVGSGNIMGLEVKNACLEYSLGSIQGLVRYWDQQRDGSCHGCNNHFYKHDGYGDTENACSVMDPMDWSQHCLKYDAFKKNAEGKPARALSELIEEACQEQQLVESAHR